jgi:predicted PurR-regulated permease PerM
MKILKGIALALLSLILLISLGVFGIAYTVNRVALNSQYMVKTLNDISFADALQEEINQNNTSGDISPELQTALVDTLRNTEPVIKDRIGIAIDDSFAYLKGQGNVPSLQDTLSKSVMNTQFVTDLLDKTDLTQLADQALVKQIGEKAGFSDSFQTRSKRVSPI